MSRHRWSAISAILPLAVLLAAVGCGSAGLDVRYTDASANAALLAVAAPRRVELRPVADRRRDTARIGVRPDKGVIVTSRPVSDIVREALVVELGANGLAVVSDGLLPVASGRGDVVIATEVEEFWLDLLTGYATTQYVGKVAIALAVADGSTGATLLTRRYIGIKRRQVAEPSEEAAREVMDAALSRTMHDLATDPALAAALARAAGTARAH